MTFFNWIKANGGKAATAELLGVSLQSIDHWLAGRSTPKALIMQRIVKVSNKQVSYDAIINETTKNRRK